MDNEVGIVTAVDEESGMVTVRMKRSSACSRCNACTSLGVQEISVHAKNDCGAKLHDNVKVSLPSQLYFTAVGVLYGFPFVGMLFGFVAGVYGGTLLGLGENAPLLGFASGVVFMSLAYWAIKQRDMKRRKARHVPLAVEVVDL